MAHKIKYVYSMHPLQVSHSTETGGLKTIQVIKLIFVYKPVFYIRCNCKIDS